MAGSRDMPLLNLNVLSDRKIVAEKGYVPLFSNPKQLSNVIVCGLNADDSRIVFASLQSPEIVLEEIDLISITTGFFLRRKPLLQEPNSSATSAK